MAAKVELRPQHGPQLRFLSSDADLVIFGGSAGGGKSWSLLLEALRHVHNPGYSAVIFRRTIPQVRNPGGLWDESMKLYPGTGAAPREHSLSWHFPSGAVIKFAHMEHDKNRLDWQGSQIPLLCFDELTHFTWQQFSYMLSRNRSVSGVRPYIRATCNPCPPTDRTGGWIHSFIGWYLDERGYAVPEKSGVVRWFVNVGDVLRWAGTREELEELYPGSIPKSFTFIGSSVYDNKILLEKDPGYLANLMALPLVEREQLLRGNWYIKPEAGKVFNSAWFEVVDAVPAGGREVRGWDLAATAKQMAGNNPDYTAGVKMRQVGDLFFVTDVIAVQQSPAQIDTLLKNTASQDGRGTAVRFEMEGGASGRRDARYIVSMLKGYDVQPVAARGDKLIRAKALAAQAEAGNVKLLRAPWNSEFLEHMHQIPDGEKDDIMDAAAIAFNALVSGALGRKARSMQG